MGKFKEMLLEFEEDDDDDDDDVITASVTNTIASSTPIEDNKNEVNERHLNKNDLQKSISSNDYMSQAEKVANIVQKGAESGSYEDVCQKIDELSKNDFNSEEYVYKKDSCVLPIVGVVVCSALIVGFLYYLLIGLGIIIYSSDFRTFGVINLVFSMSFIVIDIILFSWGLSYLKFCRRYSQYVDTLQNHSIEIIEDLAEYVDMPKKIVIKDLEKAIKMNLIPQGHFGTDYMIIILSDNMYDVYIKKQVIYDHYYRKKIQELRRMGERTESIQKLLDLGQKHIEQIHANNDLIKDKEVSKTLDRMEEIVSLIFHEVDISPNQSGKLGLLLDYYLPTTEKLLDSYINTSDKRIEVSSIKKIKHDIEETLNKLNDAFEEILNSFYQEQEFDVISDISALEQIMLKEGLV